MYKKYSWLIIILIVFGLGCLPVSAQQVDTDGDGIFDDGDGSGTAGDNRCTGGNTSNCDDNCIKAYNPDQADLDGDGIGNACEDNAVDVSGGRIEIESSSMPDITGKELTVEAWVKGSTSDLNGGILSYGSDWLGNPLHLFVKDSVPSLAITTGATTSTPDRVVHGVGPMIANAWYHIAAVLTGSGHSHPETSSCSSAVMAQTPHLDMYVNGQFSNCATTGSQYAKTPSGSKLMLGRLVTSISGSITGGYGDYLPSSTVLYGVIDEVRFWTEARTEAEIQGCMNYELGTVAGCEIDPSTLKGYWRLDEGLGSAVTDSSGNGYAGEKFYYSGYSSGWLPWTGGWVDGYPFTELGEDSDGDGYSLLEGDCNDGDAEVYPGAADVCDGKDNDCDISTADGIAESWYGNACDGPDGDECEEGVYECAGGVLSCTDDTGDDEVEVCDGQDNDCDGQIDEGLGTTTCGLGVCERTIDNCVAGEVQTCSPGDPTEMPEATCSDNLDNDCDSLTDMNDTDCSESDSAIDVSGGRIEIESSSMPDITGKELTVEAWVKGNTSDLNGGVLSYGSDWLGNPLHLFVKDSVPALAVTTGVSTSTPDAMVQGAGEMIANAWYHIAAVLTGSGHSHPESESCSSAVMAQTPHLDMYVNGQFSNCATTGSQYAKTPSGSKLMLGRLVTSISGSITGGYGDYLPSSTVLNGVIDEVRFWTVARTEAEIQGCMNYELGTVAGCEIDPSTLKGYWRLDEGFGSVVTDSSGNGYTGEKQYNSGYPSYWVPWTGGWTDGYPFTELGEDSDGDGYSVLEGDCDDGDADVYPGAADVCDGKDNDCDISTADGIVENWYGDACDGPDLDECKEGVYECAGGVQSCTDNTGDNEVEICDGLDNDCDGQIDEDLGTTTCGMGVCERSIDNCIAGEVQTCEPGDPTEITEATCSDNLDNDCDSLTDMNDTDCSESDNAIDVSGGRIEIESSSLPDITGKELTVEAWVKGNTSDLNGGILSYGSDWLGNPLHLFVKDSVPGLAVTTGATTSTPDRVVHGIGQMIANAWYHIAAVLTSSGHIHPESESCTAEVMAQTPHLDIYVNGQFSNCATTSSQFAKKPNGSKLMLGRLASPISGTINGEYGYFLNSTAVLNGVIDEVRFWTEARTEAEIQGCMNYELGTAPGCEIDSSVLKGYWKLDEGISSVVTDSSGNGYTGVKQQYEYYPTYGWVPWSGGWVDGYPYSAMAEDNDEDGYSWLEGDCDDGDNEVYPGASDVCDGKDNDCDISTGDGVTESWLGEACDGPDVDECKEGVYECAGGVQSCTDDTGDDEVEVCDGEDNDCDGVVDNLIRTTTCGTGACLGNTGFETCVDGSWINDTCDPLLGATGEICDNADNDCDGAVDDDLSNQTTCGVGACAGNTGEIICIAGSWVNNNCDPLAGAAPEIPGNAVDDDCNPLTFDTPSNVDGDRDSYSERDGDCDDTNATVNPGTVEILSNALDDDCNLLTYDTPIDTDMDGDMYTEAGGDCDDTNAAVNPGAEEVWMNGIDDDCNAMTLDNPVDTDDDGDRYVENRRTRSNGIDLARVHGLSGGDCDDTNAAVNPGATEIPGNGIDDDCNPRTADSAADTDDDGDGYTEQEGDCDDTKPYVNPDAAEVPGNGIDDDCNRATSDS